MELWVLVINSPLPGLCEWPDVSMNLPPQGGNMLLVVTPPLPLSINNVGIKWRVAECWLSMQI